MIAATVVSLAGIYLAYLMYSKRSLARNWLSGTGDTLHTILTNKYYVDEFYQLTVVAFTKGLQLLLTFH